MINQYAYCEKNVKLLHAINWYLSQLYLQLCPDFEFKSILTSPIS